MIYADNAATTKMGKAAINAMTACMRDTYGNPSSLFGLGQRAKETQEDARTRIAACIGPPPGRSLSPQGAARRITKLSVSPLCWKPERGNDKPASWQCQLLL